MALILFQRKEHHAVITLNRPARLNALSAEMFAELERYFQLVENDRELRAIILTGAGTRAFCGGTDISELTSLDESGAHDAAIRGQAICNRIEGCFVPVIAAVNGLAAGGGLELVLASHLRIASTDATFSLPEVRLGVIPGYGGTQRLVREVGQSRALAVMLAGESLSAENAERVGLVNRIMKPEVLLSEAEALAEQIAKMAPLAVRACLRAVVDGLKTSLAEGMELEAELFASLFSSRDMKEGAQAFLEKRTPEFTGT